MKLHHYALLTPPEYKEWRIKRINSIIHLPAEEIPVMEFPPRKAPTEAEIIRAEYEAKQKEWDEEREKLEGMVGSLQLDIHVTQSNLAQAMKQREEDLKTIEYLREKNQELRSENKRKEVAKPSIQ